MSTGEDTRSSLQVITLTPIGHVERDEGGDALRGDELRDHPSRIVLDPALSDGLLGLEPGDDITVLCFFHRAERDLLQVHPMGDTSSPLRGVFATRSPARPNPIAVTSARIQRITGNVLHVVGLDAMRGTPVIDIKSFADAFDAPYSD